MATEWSEDIAIAELSDEPALSDELAVLIDPDQPTDTVLEIARSLQADISAHRMANEDDVLEGKIIDDSGHIRPECGNAPGLTRDA